MWNVNIICTDFLSNLSLNINLTNVECKYFTKDKTSKDGYYINLTNVECKCMIYLEIKKEKCNINLTNVECK